MGHPNLVTGFIHISSAGRPEFEYRFVCFFFLPGSRLYCTTRNFVQVSSEISVVGPPKFSDWLSFLYTYLFGGEGQSLNTGFFFRVRAISLLRIIERKRDLQRLLAIIRLNPHMLQSSFVSSTRHSTLNSTGATIIICFGRTQF